MKAWVRVLPLLLIPVLIFFTLEFIRWRQYAWKMMRLELKMAVRGGRTRDWDTRGKICWNLGKLECSREAYGRILEVDPHDQMALARLAILSAKLKMWKEAEPLFASYLSAGGQEAEAIYWYAKTLEATKSANEARRYLYMALFRQTSFVMAANDLIDLLVKMKHPFESLGLIAQYEEELLVKPGTFRQATVAVEDELARDSAKAKVTTEFLVPNVKGEENFYLPTQFRKDGPIHFLRYNAESARITVNLELLEEERMPQPGLSKKMHSLAKGRDLASDPLKVEVPSLKVGSLSLGSATLYVCESCTPEIGRQALGGAKVSFSEDLGVKFLQIGSKRE